VGGVRDIQAEDEAAAAFGLRIERDTAEVAIDVWPDNLAVVDVFVGMSTQWHRDLDGNRRGLRYEVLPWVLRMAGVARADWPDVHAGIGVMERETLRLWREKAHE
jgi:hypothetical protein